MPKQSTKSVASKKKPSSVKTVTRAKVGGHTLAVKSLPWLAVVALVGLIVSMEVVFWPGEIYVSYLPQILIFLAGFGMAYLSFVIWLVIRDGLHSYVEQAGHVTMAAFGLIAALGIYVLVSSTHIVEPAHFVLDFKPNETPLRVGTFNKLYNSENFVSDTDFLLAKQVDVVSLQEVDASEVQAVSRSLGYEYSFVTDCGCSAYETEVGIVSKYPIINAITVYEHQNSVILRSLIRSEEHGEFVVYSVHMHVPFQPDDISKREDTYNRLAEAVNSEDLPVFVMGDFNTTVYSPQMGAFVDTVSEKVENVVARRWPQCSWFGFTEVGCARIDHVFVPTGSSIKDLVIGEENFSDHRPIVVNTAL